MTDTSRQTITILGAGYVGLTTATILAHAGYTVYMLEPNKERLDVIKQGKSFFYEKGLDQLISSALAKGSLIPTDSYADSVSKSSIVFSSVGTPDNPDGSSNLTYIFAAASETLQHIKPGAIFVQKSTVPVGTGEKLEALMTEFGKDIAYVSNPEFLREGTAIYDTLFFDRVVAGGNDTQAIHAILDVYRTLEKSRVAIAKLAGIKTATRIGTYIATDLNSAELIKVTANAFLALKISFANSIAKLADTVNADIVEVMDAVGADKRIGRQFLSAGRGYGGGCFPKDVSGLIASGLERGVDLEIMTAAQAVNASMPGYILTKLKHQLEKPFNQAHITVLGLAFKPGTSDVRKSPGITIANSLVKQGTHVTSFDPEAVYETTSALHSSVVRAPNLREAIAGSDAVIIATDWPEFMNININTFSAAMAGTIFVDAVNKFDKQAVQRAGLTYIGVGR
jgi:UDPglucose 6-dehydrogenase